MSCKVYSAPLSLPLLLPFIDIDNLVAVFDVDDVLWPQFAPAAELAGVDASKHDNFYIEACLRYTAEEKKRLYDAFADSRPFEKTEFYLGVEKISVLHELGVRIEVNSNSFTQDIAEVKRRRLKSAMPFLRDSDLILTVSGQKRAGAGKEIGTNVTFFVDDNPYNIVASKASYNFLPSKTWNCTPAERDRMSDKNFYVFSNLDCILDTMIRSIRSWVKFQSTL